MKKLYLKKGFSHPLSKKITLNMVNLDPPEKIGLVPCEINGIKPKLLVSENDEVKIGTPLFMDKNNPKTLFLSPGSGKISKIKTGLKRIINEIEIDLHENEDHEELEAVTETLLRGITKEELIEILLKNGVWPFLKSLPYNKIPDPEETPAKILVKMSDNVPYYPLPESWLKDRLKSFQHGLNILKKICPEVIVYADEKNHFIRSECQNTINFLVNGRFPSFNPGVVLYKIKKTPEENKSWYIDGQNLAALGETLLKGKYFTEKVFLVGGDKINEPYHIKSRSGAPVKSLIKPDLDLQEKLRFISGDVFSGFKTNENGYTGFYESSLSIIPEGDEKEYFGFVRLGAHKPSYSKTFLSAFVNSKTNSDCNTHGEKRACINCGYCESICPVDILPQFTMKSLHADDIESALSHGLLDCVDCSLCTFVCPSKISLSEIFREAKDKFLKEEKA